MKKDFQSTEELQKELQTNFEAFLKEEMSNAQFLDIVRSSKAKGKERSMNTGGMWILQCSGIREIGDDTHYDFSVALECPSCSNPMTYGKDEWANIVWKCGPCDVKVGCMKGSIVPKGFPATREVRKLRAATHELVQEMVKKAGGFDAHKYVYYWMTKKLNYDPDETFITLANVTAQELKKIQQYVIEWLRSDDPSKVADLYKID